MKITAVLLLAACLQVSARTNGQTVTLKVKDAPMKQVFLEIQRQTGLNVMVDQALLESAGKVTLDVRAMPVPEVLNICLKNEPLTYTIVDGRIVVKSKPTAVFQPADNSTIELPLIDVHGRIVNENGEPVAATVSVKGTRKAVSTDENGEFTIKGIDPSATLVITGVGIEPFEVKVDGRSTLNTLSAKIRVAEGEAILLNTGYQKLPKERATGSFASINNELFNRRVGPDVLTRLEGIVPGLLVNRNVNQDGSDISIRGYSTLFANAKPLVVVDDFPFDGSLNDINPNDIENISILKDAAASSIWGVRSGNGVIVITTKRGRRSQRLDIDVNANLTVSERPNVFKNPNFLPSNDFIEIEKLLFQQGYYDNRLIDPAHPVVSPVVQILADQRAGVISASDADAKINVLKNIDMRDQLSQYFYRAAINQQYSIGLRGGGEKNDYSVSIGFDKTQQGFVGNDMSRLTINSNSHFYPTSKLTLSAGVNFIYNGSTNNSPVSNITSGSTYATIYPYAQFADANGRALSVARDYNYFWVTNALTNSPYLNWEFKPLDELHNLDNRFKTFDNRMVFGAKYQILNELSVQADYQYQYSNSTNDNYYSQATYYARNLINQFTNVNGTDVTRPVPPGGILFKAYSTTKSNRGRISGNYSKDWNRTHAVSAVVGAEINEIVTTGSTNVTYGYDKNRATYQVVDFVNYFPLFPDGFGTSQIPNNLNFDGATDRYLSYFSNAAYTYKERYIVSLSGRIDKSNLFGVKTNQKAAPLYSVGGAWEASKEKFYRVSFLPNLKLRATYGYNANIYKGVAAVPTIFYYSNAPITGQSAANISTPGNPELRWEKVRMINFGMDFGLKDNFVTGSIEYYSKKGIDMFGESPLAPSSGLPSFFGNNASIKGHGYDVSLNAHWISKGNFRWTTNIIVSHAVDKVTSYDIPDVVQGYLHSGAVNVQPRIGNPLFGIYSYRWAGLTHDTGDPQGYLDGKPSTDYASIISKSTTDSLVFNGSARPLTFGSIRNTLEYKRFSLSFNIVFKLNYYFRKTSTAYSALPSWEVNKDFFNRWMSPGDETRTNVPSMPSSLIGYSNLRDQFYSSSEALIDKGDHVRFQDISLSYEPKFNKIGRMKFQSIKLYAYVNNIGLLWRANKDGLDPDTPYGISSQSLPIPTTYSIGANLHF